MKRHTLIICCAALGLVLLTLTLFGCESLGSVSQVGTALGVATGVIDESQAASINESARAVAKSFEDITPEQEYYIGRAVGAVILEDYSLYEDEAANYYINLLGQSLALSSDRPELFNGYRFQILDSDEINAFATPGGHILLTRGILRLARSEDGVAAILAHEIGHIVHLHGLKSIKTSRINTALTSVALTSVQVATDDEIAELTAVFEDSIKDVTSTLVNNGYSRETEREADRAAVKIMSRVGYDPRALIGVLEEMDRELEPGGLDFAKTHPDPEDRIADIERFMGSYTPKMSPQGREAREARYRTTLAGL
jgi:beta-barrel assembly-enhancing protease